MKIYFRALDSELPSFEATLPSVPRVGEQIDMPDGETYIIRKVAWVFSVDGSADPYVFID